MFFEICCPSVIIDARCKHEKRKPIWGLHCVIAKPSLVSFFIMLSANFFPTFRRNVSPSPSGLGVNHGLLDHKPEDASDI